ncbi:MAG: HD domain-containing protein [Deltaproteobacteria bacterium]|nr:MAG: HD domain-containing protein [Deltaproteobacteria bacterium]
MEDELLDLLYALDGVQQDPHHHPEGDALFHSLQVFAHAMAHSNDPELWAAALFHDIGKAEGTYQHAERGAEWLSGLLSERIVQLVRHHMDLLHHPKRTRQRWHGTPFLQDLETLRTWDKAGRDPFADVPSPEEAVAILMEDLFANPLTNGPADEHHEYKERL